MITESSITDAKPDALPSIAAELARLTAILTQRLTAPTVAAVEPERDELLDVSSVAALLNIKPEQVRRLAALRPYRSTALGPKTLRWSRAGVLRLIKRRTS